MFGHTISLNVSTYHCVNLRIVQAEVIGVDPKDVNVPVVGGHAGVTILPILSQVSPKFAFNEKEVQYLTNRIQNGGTEVVEAKAGTGSATLSMAYAAAKFGEACLRALQGETGIIECAYVASEVGKHHCPI
jgi:malate dehydrogenase